MLQYYDEQDIYLSNIKYDFPLNDIEGAKLVHEKKLNEDRCIDLDQNLTILNKAILLIITRGKVHGNIMTKIYRAFMLMLNLLFKHMVRLKSDMK